MEREREQARLDSRTRSSSESTVLARRGHCTDPRAERGPEHASRDVPFHRRTDLWPLRVCVRGAVHETARAIRADLCRRVPVLRGYGAGSYGTKGRGGREVTGFEEANPGGGSDGENRA